MPRPYPVHEVKAKLSEILRKVKHGQSVTISERGKEIARVVPLERPLDLARRVAELEHDGVILRRDRGNETMRPIARRRGALRRFLQSRR